MATPVRPTADLNRLLRSVANVADLEVVDGNTRNLNRVTIYPRGGRIGVTGEAVAVAKIAPVKARKRGPSSSSCPFQPWVPELYPQVYPWNPRAVSAAGLSMLSIATQGCIRSQATHGAMVSNPEPGIPNDSPTRCRPRVNHNFHWEGEQGSLPTRLALSQKM